jgi:hypothetical protein
MGCNDGRDSSRGPFWHHDMYPEGLEWGPTLQVQGDVNALSYTLILIHGITVTSHDPILYLRTYGCGIFNDLNIKVHRIGCLILH